MISSLPLVCQDHILFYFHFLHALHVELSNVFSFLILTSTPTRPRTFCLKSLRCQGTHKSKFIQREPRKLKGILHPQGILLLRKRYVQTRNNSNKKILHHE